MNNHDVQQIAQAALRVLKPVTVQSSDKMVTVNFQPTDTYADSFVRSFRKGAGFMGLGSPDPGSPIVSLEIAITLKPGVMTNEWVGYSFDIKNPEINPEVTLSREWPEKGGMVPFDLAKLGQLTPHILAVMAGQVTPGNVAAPRQSPATMY